MFARSTSRDNDKTTGSYMSEDQLATYLQDLRTSRTARLNGSRPAPPSRFTSKRIPPTVTGEQVPSSRQTSTDWPAHASHLSLSSTRPQNGIDVIILEDGSIDNPLIPQPLSFKSKTSSESNTPLKRSPTIPYVESGARWMERQEAHSLRMALEDMDLQEDERIHIAAQDEASSLVLEHQKSGTLKKPESPYNNPDIPVRDYKAHLRKGSYSRSLSVVPADSEHTRNDSTTRCSITSPEPSKDNEETRSETPSSNTSGHADTETRDATNVETTQKPHKSKSYHGLANAVKRDVASARRRISSGGNRKPSSERGHFMNPADKIWEERQEATMPIVKNHTEVTEKRIKEPESASVKSAEPEMPRHVRRNPFARVRFAQEKLERTNSAPVPTAKRFNPVEVQKNTPTQSRKPWYLSNKPVTPVPTMPVPVEADEETMGEGTRMKDGKEIRSDDIRTATSMKRKDRSPNLPQPTAVSDSPGRPIVSFQPGWKTQEVERNQDPIKPVTRTLTDSSRALPPSPIRHATSIGKLNRTSDGRSTATFNPGPLPSVAVPSEGPTIPFINLPDDDGTPSRVLPEEPPEMPSIFIDCSPTREKAGFDVPPSPPKRVSTKEAPLSRPLPRPLPNPSSKSASPDRPGPHHAATAPLPGTKPHYTPSVRRNTALCAHCALPIAGRILSAAGERFHPECFKCHECGTNLECVAFFPEPDQKHYERIARIQQRNQGLEVQVPNGMTEEDVWRMEVEDGDESLRFFCHLDFHELFSPRCKSCKTPIEGEVVVACGAEWHVGHFFCAQCGDPFDSNMPFVEKEGYAWCVGCHTNRYSPKCRGCRKPITDVVVNALGKEWHGDCFCCMECGGSFDDGRYFLRGDSEDPVCVRCEERRLKS